MVKFYVHIRLMLNHIRIYSYSIRNNGYTYTYVGAGSGGYFPDDDEDGCSEGDYLCSVSRKCIPETWLCDYDNDCGYWEDELESICGKNTVDFIILFIFLAR